MKTTLKDFLVDVIPEELHKFLPRGFEVIGDIAILEIPEELTNYEKEMGEALLKVNSHVKVVLKKSGIHEGEFRTQKMDYLVGEKRKETTYLENGIKLRLNVETVYFSSKLGTERANLSEKIKENSKVLVMFSGCGPYTFNILRKQPNVQKIDSIEINPEGHKYALENLELNKNLLKKSKRFFAEIQRLKEENKLIKEKEVVKKINSKVIGFYCGDVKTIVENELKREKYDEIFMPLPKDAEKFLDSAFKASYKGTLIHMYSFAHEDDFPHKIEDVVKKIAKESNKEVKIIETRKVGQSSPRKYRVCCDFRLTN